MFYGSYGLDQCLDLVERAMTADMARQFTAIFKPLGFHYVTLDLEGYRQGSLNAVLQSVHGPG